MSNDNDLQQFHGDLLGNNTFGNVDRLRYSFTYMKKPDIENVPTFNSRLFCDYDVKDKKKYDDNEIHRHVSYVWS